MNAPKTPEPGVELQTLDTLARGQSGRICFIDDTDPQIQRLMTLGLVEGTEVERGHSAIGGDPTEFRVFGLGISMRSEQARCFSVSPVSAG